MPTATDYFEEYDVQLSWFRAPAGDDAGTTNLCYLALDLPIVRGHATDPAVRRDEETIDYATLLERTAALAGAMKGVGVGPGERVAVLLDDPLDQLIALLAVLRAGAVHVTLPEADPVATIDEQEPSLVISNTLHDFDVHTPAAVFLRGPEPRDHHRDLDWEIAVKAGRTDPAGSEPWPVTRSRMSSIDRFGSQRSRSTPLKWPSGSPRSPPEATWISRPGQMPDTVRRARIAGHPCQ